MHEIARGDGRGPVLLPPPTKDTCVRAVFAASRPVTAALVDQDGATLADAAATRDGLLGAEGPVCYRSGSHPLLRFAEQGADVSYVVWAAP